MHVIELIRFKDWGQVRIFNDHRPIEIPHREGTASEIKQLLDEGWEISLSTPNIVVIAKEVMGKWQFKMFERILALLLFLLPAHVVSAQPTHANPLVGEIINVDAETKTLTVYSRSMLADTWEEKMYDLTVGPKNWSKFGHLFQEGDFIYGTYRTDFRKDGELFYLLWKVERITRPFTIYRSKQCDSCSD